MRSYTNKDNDYIVRLAWSVIVIIVIIFSIIFLVAACEPRIAPFNEGDCVVHKLDKETTGIVVDRGSQTVYVRFSPLEVYKSYNYLELESC